MKQNETEWNRQAKVAKVGYHWYDWRLPFFHGVRWCVRFVCHILGPTVIPHGYCGSHWATLHPWLSSDRAASDLCDRAAICFVGRTTVIWRADIIWTFVRILRIFQHDRKYAFVRTPQSPFNHHLVQASGIDRQIDNLVDWNRFSLWCRQSAMIFLFWKCYIHRISQINPENIRTNARTNKTRWPDWVCDLDRDRSSEPWLDVDGFFDMRWTDGWIDRRYRTERQTDRTGRAETM